MLPPLMTATFQPQGTHMEFRSGHTQDITASPSQSEVDAHPLFAPQQSVGAADRCSSAPGGMTDRLQRGHVLLDSAQLRQLRQGRLMSQQDLANDCWRRNIPLSLTTIKRAELGRPVRFRIAREFARCLDVPVTQIVRNEGAIAVLDHDAH